MNIKSVVTNNFFLTQYLFCISKALKEILGHQHHSKLQVVCGPFAPILPRLSFPYVTYEVIQLALKNWEHIK